ncbi:hypothetical protein CBS147339_2699 [Penicillium roqueforti]|uniref:Apple domain-containing protein n=1 Tax=Penicillium roqueforti (strain FM164) TaxID=1365484 RepID=W6Q172_PENRF|nr:hypothetical protein CBS147339_2699 [Penicillium roqueforti]CDM27964.1 hypothetical protein PROQFM164_S01g001775 [Penicillium roqueforti FM164]KAI3091180.1 hypothetical protein CBS147338_8513 [Penicillium roqueforti]KAI3141992.1 hypothetical protein CBS147325_5689 [Penicillium roqueforti]KAI3176445.1 hypothetical protein DTO032C6_9555 [Penicillium roqueforti]
MTAKSFLLLLGAASAFANQIPIGVGSVCLSSATPNDCCTSGAPTPTGEVTIDDRTFKFTCGSALGSLNPKTAQKVSNAHECASLCADDLSCEASSFKAHGKPPRGNNCFFVLGDNLDQRSDEEWITFTEVFPSCLESDDRNACCSNPDKQEDEVVIGNGRWKWTCKTILSSLNKISRPAANALECASLCASEDCEAISFRTLGDHKAGNCFFVLSSNKDQQQATKFMSIVKIENIGPPTPEPQCEKYVEEKEQCAKEKEQCLQDKKECDNSKDTCQNDLEQAKHNLEICQTNQVDPAKLAQCEADKLTAQSAEEDCRRHSGEIEEKKKECRAEQHKCESEKGDLSIQKQQCENDKNKLALDLTNKNDEITALNSQITSLKGKLDTLQQSYDALNVNCNGEGADGKCRTNLFDAELRDDQCIITAGNEKFKIHYAKLDDPGPADLGTGRANSFKDCAEKCANYKGAKKCVRFMWKTDGNDRACYMRSTGLGTVPTKSSLFSSGQLLV